MSMNVLEGHTTDEGTELENLELVKTFQHPPGFDSGPPVLTNRNFRGYHVHFTDRAIFLHDLVR